jgi:predicted enzyme related to lactoylglutathione lyase
VISAVAKVVLPVGDQESAKRFWTEKVGFDVATDQSYGEERWIEVSPPGGGPVLVLSPRPSGQSSPQVPDTLPHSPVMFTCEDIRRTYRELSERGVDFAAPPERMHFGWWSMFTDQDGTRYALGQWTTNP